jgi:hypothetical protein
MLAIYQFFYLIKHLTFMGLQMQSSTYHTSINKIPLSVKAVGIEHSLSMVFVANLLVSVEYM